MKASLLTGAAVAVAFVSAVQYQHRTEYPLNKGHMEVSVQQAELDTDADVWIFGHAYPASQIRSWYSRIDGNYCVYGDRVYDIGTVPGEPISYPQFVFALQQGFYFRELAGAGVRSDGDQEIFSYRLFSSRRPRREVPEYNIQY